MGKLEWITFDCYGTLIDWEEGITKALAPFLPFPVDRDKFSRRYIELEAQVEKERYRPYREVLAVTSARLLDQMGLRLPLGKENTLPDSLPDWPAFPEVSASLRALRAAGHRLAILSNVDRDLLASSVRKLGATIDLLVTAQDCQSYKPARGHWHHFQTLSEARPDTTLHVAASLYHDIIPASKLGYRTVFINRHGETVAGTVATRILRDLSDLPHEVKELETRSLKL